MAGVVVDSGVARIFERAGLNRGVWGSSPRKIWLERALRLILEQSRHFHCYIDTMINMYTHHIAASLGVLAVAQSHHQIESYWNPQHQHSYMQYNHRYYLIYSSYNYNYNYIELIIIKLRVVKSI